MRIYEISFDIENYRLMVPADESELDGSNLWINGSLKLSSWSAPEMRYTEPEHSSESIADVTQITPGFFAFNEKALGALGDLLEKYGELLNLPLQDNLLRAFNPHNEIDCLDSARCKWQVRRDGSRGRLEKLALKEESVGDSEIFQVPEYIQTKVFVKDHFRRTYDQAELTGLRFIQL